MSEFPNIARSSFSYLDMIGQDTWALWTPVRTGWTDTGTPTVSGRFHVMGRQCFFQAQIDPATDTETTEGTSYIALPLAALGYGGHAGMYEIATPAFIGGCSFKSSRVYVPTQAATGDTLIVSGWYEV